MSYYLFSPLLDEKGEQVVRIPKVGEYFRGHDGRVRFVSVRLDTHQYSYPILTAPWFTEDPLGPIKWAYGAYKYCSGEALDDIPRGFAEILWQAIVAVMERGEGK